MSYLCLIACLVVAEIRVVRVREMQDSLRWWGGGSAAVQSVICDQSWPKWLVWEGSGLDPCAPQPRSTPLLSASFLVSVPPPPHPRGSMVSPEGRTCCRARLTIFRLTAFTFGLTRASWKQTDKTKDSKLMTRAPPTATPTPSGKTQPLTIDSLLGVSLLLTPQLPSCPDFWSPPNHKCKDTHIWTLTHWHTQTHTQHYHINLFLNSVTRGIWFRLSQEERDRDARGKEWVWVRDRGNGRRPLYVRPFIIMC